MRNEHLIRITEIIDHLLDNLESTQPSIGPLEEWKKRALRFLSGLISIEELKSLQRLNTPTYSMDKAAYKSFMVSLKKGIYQFPDMYLDPAAALAELGQSSEAELAESKDENPTSNKNPQPKTRRVFIVHGHDDFAKVEVARTVERLGLEAVILHEQQNAGRTIIEKFEQNASVSGFAIVILTPDDIGYPNKQPESAKPRARQNVILELGYFSGLLGRNKICVLYKDGVEVPTDYLGVIYTRLDDVGAWRLDLAKELKLAGLDVDLNRL